MKKILPANWRGFASIELVLLVTILVGIAATVKLAGEVQQLSSLAIDATECVKDSDCGPGERCRVKVDGNGVRRLTCTGTSSGTDPTPIPNGGNNNGGTPNNNTDDCMDRCMSSSGRSNLHKCEFECGIRVAKCQRDQIPYDEVKNYGSYCATRAQAISGKLPKGSGFNPFTDNVPFFSIGGAAPASILERIIATWNNIFKGPGRFL